MALNDIGNASEINEVAMLIIGCRDEVISVLDPEKPQRGWAFPSKQVVGDMHPRKAAVLGAFEKVGYDAKRKSIQLVKTKTRKDIPFSSYFVELTPQEFETIGADGPRGHSIQKVSKDALGQYLDPGRYDMAVSRVVGIS